MARLNEPSAVEPSLANLQRVDQDITEIRRDMALMQRETKMRLIKGNRIIGLLVLLALLFTVLPLLLSLLK
jgi:tetrahydromethanopterin S-methyltransferase subunit F